MNRAGNIYESKTVRCLKILLRANREERKSACMKTSRKFPSSDGHPQRKPCKCRKLNKNDRSPCIKRRNKIFVVITAQCALLK